MEGGVIINPGELGTQPHGNTDSN